MRGLAVVKRRDQRLHDCDGAIVRARVAPRLEVMRGGNVPVTDIGRFVVVETQVRAQLNFVQPIQIEPQIDRRVISRIAADDDERFYSAVVDVSDEFAQRLSLID